MRIVENFRRNRAIGSYLRKLPRLLAKNYGKSKTYTPKQVRRTIERSGLSVAYVCYGIAIFSGRDMFDKHHQEIGESCSYTDMRCEIGNKYFQGNSDFDSPDVLSVSSDFGGGFDAGGFDGGGFDGGGGGDGGGD